MNLSVIIEFEVSKVWKFKCSLTKNWFINKKHHSKKNYIRNIIELNYEQFVLGDINADDTVNVQDIILLINMILNGESEDSADINSDGVIDILDIVQVINIILS